MQVHPLSGASSLPNSECGWLRALSLMSPAGGSLSEPLLKQLSANSSEMSLLEYAERCSAASADRDVGS